MTYQMLIQNGQQVFDVTRLLEGEVSLENSVNGSAGKICFRIMRDGVVSFKEGCKVLFYVDKKIRFIGWIMRKSRTSDQIISVTAYDQLFYLVKNKDTYLYQNKKASELLIMIAKDYGLQTGQITDTGWVIPYRIEEGKTLMDMIYTALEITKEHTGNSFYLLNLEGKLCIRSKKELELPIYIRPNGQIKDFFYTTDISQHTYNTVRLFQAGRLEAERLAFEAKNDSKIKEWGRLQYYEHVDHRLTQGQLKAMADTILSQQCRVEKTLQVEVLNPPEQIQAGNSIILEIPDMAEFSLKGSSFIEKTTAYYADGECRIKMQIVL